MVLSSHAAANLPRPSPKQDTVQHRVESARSPATVQPPLWRPRQMIKLAAAIFFSVALVPAAASAQAKSGKGSGYEQLNLFGEAFERIRQDAVEPVTEAKLIGAAIAGMLSGLAA